MTGFDLDRYLARIRWSGPRHPSYETLAGILRAHMTAIPRLLDCLREAGAADTRVVVGGVVPDEDVAALLTPGVADVPPPERPPETMDWDLWLGCSEPRPYSSAIAPFNWRVHIEHSFLNVGSQGNRIGNVSSNLDIQGHLSL